ncbi:hypothetical protein OGAPHI_006390 [Ogataea philodendri]|uniref:Uncharacterized protein n=1 Tax=Ogataea philodendri TaxID=1378263 RepID=A0A9P8NYH9_9ASCO|nr:uncharacterized protein OGAPHI_006390 [Ogataea philodendri]KAH3661542.1 hypothetical protein OGAPHI_006390 [Ogataea philodendri]
MVRPADAPLWKYPQSYMSWSSESFSKLTLIMSGKIRELKFILGIGNLSVMRGFLLDANTAPLPSGMVKVRKATFDPSALCWISFSWSSIPGSECKVAV